MMQIHQTMKNNDHRFGNLKIVADAFRREGVSYAVGASCMLYLRGICSEFHDIDILVVKEDFAKACRILENFADEQIPEHRYSSYYRTYLFEDTEIDLIGEFILQGEDRSLKRDTPADLLMLEDMQIVLDTADRWLRNYRLMGREARVRQLELYFRNVPVNIRQSFGEKEWQEFCGKIISSYSES